ncbi:MAG: hypothetical protein DRO76_05575, partial [Candidatus Altiarchaeales archaeon]
SLTDPEFFERNFKRIVIGGYVLMDTDQLPRNLDPKIVGFERIEELEDPRYGHAGLHAYRKVGEVRNLAVIMKIDQYISEMEIEKEEIYGIKDITEFYKNQFRKIKKKVGELPPDQKIVITNALRGMGFSEKAKNKEKLKDAFGEVFDVLTLTDDEVREYCVRGNPVIIRLPEDKAKEFKVDTKEYVKEPSKKEVEKFIDNLCKKHPDLDREYLRDMYIDLETKLKQYIASNDAYIDRKARFIQNKLNPEGVIVWVEGMGWCELRETDGEFVLRRIKKDKIPEFPAHVVLTDEVLDGEILPIVESVTGIEDERLLEDWKRIKAASPMDVVEYEYGLKKGTAIARSELGKSAISPSLGDVSLVGTPIHEITHLEDIRYRSGIGIIDFYLGKLLGRLSPRGYREGVAVLAKKNGCNRLADMRKDIAIQVLGNHHGALMVATRIAEYLEEKGLDQKEIIDSLEEMGVSHYLMLDILGDGWKYGEIDSKLFKKTRKYYARAYEIAKYFGEDVQVLKISRDKWKEFLKARKDWRKLHRHELKTEFLDYDLYEMGGEPGLGFSTMQWLQLLEKKRGMLEWEKELLKSKKRSVREKVKKVLKERGMSVDDRLRAIEEELSEVEEKTRKILEGDWEGIEFEDVVWRIREPKGIQELGTTKDPFEYTLTLKEKFEIKFIFVPHETELDAKAIGKVIKEFDPDMVCPEITGYNERIIKKWGKVISKDIELRDFWIWFRGGYIGFPEFYEQLFKSLYDSKKPIYFVDVPDYDYTTYYKRDIENSRKILEKALGEFKYGNVENSIECMREYLELFSEVEREREDEIVKNISRIPEDLIERYPEFEEKDEVKLLVVFDEPHASVPYKFEEKEIPEIRFDSKESELLFRFINEINKEEVNDGEILRALLERVFYNRLGDIENKREIACEIVNKIDDDEISSFLNSLKTADPVDRIKIVGEFIRKHLEGKSTEKETNSGEKTIVPTIKGGQLTKDVEDMKKAQKARNVKKGKVTGLLFTAEMKKRGWFGRIGRKKKEKLEKKEEPIRTHKDLEGKVNDLQKDMEGVNVEGVLRGKLEILDAVTEESLKDYEGRIENLGKSANELLKEIYLKYEREVIKTQVERISRLKDRLERFTRIWKINKEYSSRNWLILARYLCEIIEKSPEIKEIVKQSKSDIYKYYSDGKLGELSEERIRIGLFKLGVNEKLERIFRKAKEQYDKELKDAKEKTPKLKTDVKKLEERLNEASENLEDV